MKLDLLACVLNNTMRLPVVEYKRVFKQIENPLYNYHSDETKWEYYNHFTYILKSQNIFIVDTSQDKLIKHFEL